MIPRWRAAGVVVLLIVLGLTGGAAPAYAHAGGLTPQNYRSVVTGIVPALPGVSAVMVNNGTQLEVRNGTRAELTILAVPVRVVPPGGVLRYREDRAVAPPAGREWSIQMRSAGSPAVVVGRLEWHDGPALMPWLLITAAFAVGGWLLGRTRWSLAGLAGGVVIVTGANIAHVGGGVAAVSGQSLIPLVIGASGVGLVCWPLSLVAVGTAVRRAPTAAFVAAVVGAMLVVAGIPDIDAFRYSQVPFAGPADLDRLLVAITLGGGAGLAAGGFAAMRRIALSRPNIFPDGTPA